MFFLHSQKCKRTLFKHFYSFVNIYLHPSSRILTQNSNMSTYRPFKIYVTRNIPPEGLEILDSHCEITQWKSEDPVPKEELIKHIPGKDALFCLLTDKIDMDVINASGKNLKVIGTMSVGYDHIDLKACKEAGIAVGYTPDVLTDATAELTVALLLSVCRRLMEGANAVRSGEWGTWSPLWMCGQTLSNSTVGIIGLGRIGMAVSKRLQPFGVKEFLYTGRSKKNYDSEINAKFVSLENLVQESDFVVITCALTKETEGMFNRNLFQKMKRNSILINTSRGGIVNQADLLNALTNGDIAAAGLDVTTPEPLPTDSPLLSLKNCVILPHIGSATVETRTTMATLCARNILAALNGQPMPAQLNI